MISLLQPGMMLQNRYLIQRELGYGGMGAVYLALDTRLGQNPVAVKENFDTSPQAQAQFQREANVLASLSHPNLPKVFDHFIEPNGRQYLVMEYVAGDDLATVVKQRGALPEAQVLDWADELLDALTYLHEQPQPILHRDIKPSNIKITPKGKVKLVDFGLVKFYNSANPRTATLVHGRGSPGYAPPEQHNPTGHTDARSDIYALGATLYHLLTGEAPATATDRIANPTGFLPPRHINAAIAPATEAVILKAIELPMSHRFQTAHEMRRALRGARPKAGTYTKTISVAPLSAQRILQSSWLWMGVGVAVILIALFVMGVRALGFVGSTATLMSTATVAPRTSTVTLTPTSTPPPTVTTVPFPAAWKQGALTLVAQYAGKRTLFTMNLSSGGEPKLLFTPSNDVSGPAWSPNGTRIAFYTAYPSTLQVVDAITGATPRFLRACVAPSWSPDGRQLICLSREGGQSHFDIVDANSGMLVRSISMEPGAVLPDWSPTGAEVAYAVTASDDRTSLWRLSLNEGLPALLAGEARENYAPDWSPDGKWIAYQSTLDSSESEIWVMDRNGQHAKRITRTPRGWSRGPAWSPDGQWIAYVSSQAGSIGADFGEVFAVSVVTGQVYQVTHTGGLVYDWRVSWGK